MTTDAILYESLNKQEEMKKLETEKLGFSHCDFAKKLEGVDRNLKVFREKQKNERVKIDEKMRRVQKDKKIVYDNVLRCKRQYEQRCKELDTAVETLDAISTYTPKEQDKLQSKKAKSKTAQESADQQYQSAVKTFEQVRESWEMEMGMACEQFQALEEQRIRFLRNEMWLYTNLGSQLSVDEDKMYEDTRLQLEKCDDMMDIAFFILNKQTGSEKPVPLKYENYYHPQSTIIMSAEIPKPKHLSLARNVPPARQLNSPSRSPAERPRLTPDEDDSNYATITPEKIADPLHASKQQDSMKTLPCLELVTASYNYTKQGPDEISLKPGDVIEVVKFEDKDWASGRNQRTGEQGAFPIVFVHKY